MRKILFCLMAILVSSNFYSQVNISATAGTATGTYTTLKGAFDAINAGTHQGTITISITANTTETATASLNASGGAASYTSVAIKPAAGVTAAISGDIASAPLVRILGSNITLDGSNTVSGTTRDLTLTNTSVTAPQVLTFIAASAAPPILILWLKILILSTVSIPLQLWSCMMEQQHLREASLTMLPFRIMR